MKCNIQTLFNHMYFKFNCILYLKSLQYSRVLNVFPLPLNSNGMLGRSAFSCLSCDCNIPNNFFCHLSPTQCRVEGEVYREKGSSRWSLLQSLLSSLWFLVPVFSICVQFSFDIQAHCGHFHSNAFLVLASLSFNFSVIVVTVASVCMLLSRVVSLC